jgi:hypothetical protein
MQPSPMAETSKFLFPSVRFCIRLVSSLVQLHWLNDMRGTSEDCSEVAAHQPRTQNANSHAPLSCLSLPVSALHAWPGIVSLRNATREPLCFAYVRSLQENNGQSCHLSDKKYRLSDNVPHSQALSADCLCHIIWPDIIFFFRSDFSHLFGSDF